MQPVLEPLSNPSPWVEHNFLPFLYLSPSADDDDRNEFRKECTERTEAR